ncbi:MAG: N-glycosylase/DNA lyase [Candidatus ainarchaeum sp.]|nr:N-glycosylase/DNA lyase [Candidatus ainarchaeum sp.]
MQKIGAVNPIIQKKIKLALKNFKKTWDSNEKIFEEMCYCILTPQSSAKGAMKSINLLKEHKLLETGSAIDKEKYLKNIRFLKTKAKRLELIQTQFPKHKIKQILLKNGLPKEPLKTREFLLKEVNGFGMKESSHFLRNIGFFEEVTILDRHILKNLVKYNVIKEIPKNLNKKKYLEIEEKMKLFCEKNNIKIEELDLIFWSNETNQVLK